MAGYKRKLLPKDFEDLLIDGDIDKLQTVFASCDINARGGYRKQTALAFSECPDDFARWLVQQGADISAVNSAGETPLHARAGHWQGRLEILFELGADVHCRDDDGNTPLHSAAGVYNAETVSLLLRHGASVDALNNEGLTPLCYALRQCGNIDIVGMANVAQVLLDASQASERKGLLTRLMNIGGFGKPTITQEMKEYVLRIGADFEFMRADYNPDHVDETSAALDQLYKLFDVSPVPQRALHDGKSPIVAKMASWEDRHQELWELLVPAMGAAQTIQGEIVRISGRIHNELEGNGGSNWDADFKNAADAFLSYIQAGVPLSEDDRAQASEIVAEVKRRQGDTHRMCELAVNWVALNPTPIILPPPDYDR